MIQLQVKTIALCITKWFIPLQECFSFNKPINFTILMDNRRQP